MKSDRFSKLSTFVVIVVSLGVLVWIAETAAPNVRSPFDQTTAGNMEASSSAVVNQPSYLTESLAVTDIKAPKGVIHAMVASTSDQKELGLSNSPSLPADSGMIFPFQYPGDYGFWMPDMNYSLDMVWISSDKKVAGITYDVPADSYPEVFYPPLPISYVMELSVGEAERFGVATGTQLVF